MLPPDSQRLKQLLEHIWQDRCVRNPLAPVKWVIRPAKWFTDKLALDWIRPFGQYFSSNKGPLFGDKE